MHKHLFLTGGKRIGKSTAIQTCLAGAALRVGGFRTVRADWIVPGRPTVHMLRADCGDEPSEENLLFHCRASRRGEDAERFDQIGCNALRDASSFDLVLMDELGPHEGAASRFQEAVLQTLSGAVPVLGVLQQSNAGFLQRIRNAENVYTMEVTRENRDLIPARIRDWYRIEWGGAPERAECEDSFGAVVFTEDKGRTYVLMVRSLRGWSFPKGHAYQGEEPEAAAMREIYEETGILADIDARYWQTVPSAKRDDRRQITFFTGRSREGRKPPVPLEVPDAIWAPADTAERRISILSDREVFRRAMEYVGRGGQGAKVKEVPI